MINIVWFLFLSRILLLVFLFKVMYLMNIISYFFFTLFLSRIILLVFIFIVLYLMKSFSYFFYTLFVSRRITSHCSMVLVFLFSFFSYLYFFTLMCCDNFWYSYLTFSFFFLVLLVFVFFICCGNCWYSYFTLALVLFISCLKIKSYYTKLTRIFIIYSYHIKYISYLRHTCHVSSRIDIMYTRICP